MSGITKLIDEKTLAKAEAELKNLGNYAKASIKLKAIIAAHEHGIAKVANIFGTSRTSLTKWIKLLKSEDANSDILLVQPGRGAKAKLTNKQLIKIKQWVKKDPSITIQKLRIRVFEFFGVELSMTTTYETMKKLSFSYITPRPKHYKQDAQKQEEFKKKSKNKDTQ